MVSVYFFLKEITYYMEGVMEFITAAKIENL